LRLPVSLQGGDANDTLVKRAAEQPITESRIREIPTLKRRCTGIGMGRLRKTWEIFMAILSVPLGTAGCCSLCLAAAEELNTFLHALRKRLAGVCVRRAISGDSN
jgi:hypothetical protein